MGDKLKFSKEVESSKDTTSSIDTLVSKSGFKRVLTNKLKWLNDYKKTINGGLILVFSFSLHFQKQCTKCFSISEMFWPEKATKFEQIFKSDLTLILSKVKNKLRHLFQMFAGLFCFKQFRTLLRIQKHFLVVYVPQKWT